MPVAREAHLKLDPKKRSQEQGESPARKKRFTPESELRFNLERCSKSGDVLGALKILDDTRSSGGKLNQYHYNVLLYLCSSAALGMTKNKTRDEDSELREEDGVLFRGKMAALVPRRDSNLPEELMQLAQKRGLEIHQQMKLEGIPPSEAAFTSLARLAVAKLDGDLAFDLVKEMIRAGVAPKLRSYDPALFIFFKTGEVEKAFEVDEHLRSFKLEPEEMELQVLLELSLRAGLGDRVYSVLHRVRRGLRSVSESMAASVEKWFRSEASGGVSGIQISIDEVRRALEMKGGGGHELGWIGSGEWSVERSSLDGDGVCERCEMKMAAVDVDPRETEELSEKLAALACEKERDSNAFKQFQVWLEKHGPFDAIVDGANVALYNQNFSEGGFSFAQLNSVVSGLQKQHGKPPLIILHTRRTNSGPAAGAQAQELLKQWRETNSFYSAATGSNDDWYWLYAALKCNCLLISNDEMRDHLFQLLGDSFFPRWKERHQVRFSFNNGSPIFEMPSKFTPVIQESENGSWHVPITPKEPEMPQTWLCIRREKS